MSILPSSARTRRRLGILGLVLALAAGVWAFSLLEPAPKKVSAEPLDPGAPTGRGAGPRGAAAAGRPVEDRGGPRRLRARRRRAQGSARRLPARDPSAPQVGHAGAVAARRHPRLSLSRERAARLDAQLLVPEAREPRPVRPAPQGSGRRSDRLHRRGQALRAAALARRLVLPDSDVPEADEGRAAAGSRSRSPTSRRRTCRAPARPARRASARPSS